MQGPTTILLLSIEYSFYVVLRLKILGTLQTHFERYPGTFMSTAKKSPLTAEKLEGNFRKGIIGFISYY